MQMLSEVDCNAKRTRSLASSIVDMSGQLVSGSGRTVRWTAEEGGPPLKAICAAAVPTAARQRIG